MHAECKANNLKSHAHKSLVDATWDWESHAPLPACIIPFLFFFCITSFSSEDNSFTCFLCVSTVCQACLTLHSSQEKNNSPFTVPVYELLNPCEHRSFFLPFFSNLIMPCFSVEFNLYSTSFTATVKCRISYVPQFIKVKKIKEVLILSNKTSTCHDCKKRKNKNTTALARYHAV